MWRKNSWYLGIIFLILLSNSVLANCDWGVGVISDNIFENYTEFKFTTRIFNFGDEGTNMTYSRKVEDVYGTTIKKYNNLSCEGKQQDKNCNTVSPNFDYGTYLIKVEIFPDCNDTNLENNYDEKLIVILPEEKLEENYTNLKINELFPDPQGYDTDAMPEGEWVELYNFGDKDLDLENLGFKDNYGQDFDIVISNSNTLNGTIIKSNNYFVIYMNGRFGFLNNDGFEKISLYKDDFLLDEVSYSGSTEGLTWGKINNIWQLTKPTPATANIYNESINESSLKIKNLYDDTFKFGEIIRAKVHVYKGDTDRYSIQAWVEDEDDNEISKRSRVSIYNKFTDYDLIIPIQVFSNCGEKYKEGEYDVIVEGLGLRDKEEIKLVSNVKDMCETIEKEVIKEVSTSITGLSEKDINTDYSVEYTSKEVKERRLAIYFFCVILVMMLLYFGLSKNG